jgi:hypothetical protein
MHKKCLFIFPYPKTDHFLYFLNFIHQIMIFRLLQKREGLEKGSPRRFGVTNCMPYGYATLQVTGAVTCTQYPQPGARPDRSFTQVGAVRSNIFQRSASPARYAYTRL